MTSWKWWGGNAGVTAPLLMLSCLSSFLCPPCIHARPKLTDTLQRRLPLPMQVAQQHPLCSLQR